MHWVVLGSFDTALFCLDAIFVFLSLHSMHRTFRLSARKNEFRKARGRTVTVEHGAATNVVSIQPASESSSQASTSHVKSPASEDLVITIPIGFLADCEVFSIIGLRERIEKLSIL